MTRIFLTGTIEDAWLSEKGEVYISMKPNEITEGVLNDLTYYQNTHTEITLSIDGKPPIRIIDLAYEKHELELKGD